MKSTQGIYWIIPTRPKRCDGNCGRIMKGGGKLCSGCLARRIREEKKIERGLKNKNGM